MSEKKIEKAQHEWGAGNGDCEIIKRIADRAEAEIEVAEKALVEGSLACAHFCAGPLRLEELEKAEPADFAHDVLGIGRHLDRWSGCYSDFFEPRFALPGGHARSLEELKAAAAQLLGGPSSEALEELDHLLESGGALFWGEIYSESAAHELEARGWAVRDTFGDLLPTPKGRAVAVVRRVRAMPGAPTCHGKLVGRLP